MKFNTITYDANLPTVQQVNVPTNSDYKIGMKVKRNGSVQSIKPSEYTIYTGEINVIPPTDFIGAAKSVASSIDSMVVLYQPEATAEMNGKVVKAKDLRFEASYDDGATWQEVAPLDLASIVQIIDRSAGTNNYVAQMNPLEKKWYLLSGGQVVGEAAEITMPTTFRFLLSAQASSWSFTSFPCQFRVIIPYGGYEERVTYPVDQEKTNGYVTITKASGDEANFKQYGVHIDKGYDYNDTYKISGQYGSTAPDPNPTEVVLTAKDIGLTGLLQKAEDYASVDTYYWRKATSPSDDLSAWSHRPNIFWPNDSTSSAVNTAFISKKGDTAVMVYRFNQDYTATEADGPYVAGQTFEKGWYFVDTELSGVSYIPTKVYKERILEQDDPIMYAAALKFTANYYWAYQINMKFGTPFSADFKLNINEFKSQSGDIAETLADGSSVKVDGTFADGTDFSFDFCTK